MATASENLPGSESGACRETDAWRNWGSPSRSHAVSSGSKAGMPSDRDASTGGGSARSTEEAGQCPRREGAEQNSLPGARNTAAPEADRTVSTKLAGLVARARTEDRLTNVVQYVDEELLRLAFRSSSNARSKRRSTSAFAPSSTPSRTDGAPGGARPAPTAGRW